MRRATFKAFLAALIVAVIAAILVAQRPSSADAVVTPTIPANTEPFAPLPGLDTAAVGASLHRLADSGFISGKVAAR